MRYFDIAFLFFFNNFFDLIFWNVFHNSFIVRSRSSFLFSQRKFFELCQDLSCYVFFCFVVWRSFSFYICSHSKAEKVKFSEWLLPLTNGICTTCLVFWDAFIFFQFRSLSVSISIIWHAGLFFRSYSGNLPAMLQFILVFVCSDNLFDKQFS